MSTSITPDTRIDGLRERHTLHRLIEGSSSDLSSGQETPQDEIEEVKEMNTFGRTPDGTSMLPSPIPNDQD